MSTDDKQAKTDQGEEVGETTTTLEEAQEKGFLGTHQDPEPNETYTFAEQAKHMPEKTTRGSAPADATGETGTAGSKSSKSDKS